jgi:DNA (cytosine-5)-methyltransferase 1
LSRPIDPATENFEPRDFIVECEKYGIPQARHRVILLGVREDFIITPDILAPQSEVPIEAVIAGLPRLRSGFSKEYDDAALWRQELRSSVHESWIKGVHDQINPGLANYIVSLLEKLRCPLDNRGGEYIECSANVRDDLKWWYADRKLQGVCNHSSRGHMRRDVYRYVYSACYADHFGSSPKLREFPSELLPEHKNALSGHFDDRFRVQIYGRPSTTITSHISKDGHYYIHPDPSQGRSLTVREAARLQTFPDNYYFCGNRTQQYVQVGNAVPPLLAYKIAEIVRNFLERAYKES